MGSQPSLEELPHSWCVDMGGPSPRGSEKAFSHHHACTRLPPLNCFEAEGRRPTFPLITAAIFLFLEPGCLEKLSHNCLHLPRTPGS